jgi:hypothetical protein
MAAKKNKKPSFTTPVGEALYPRLNEPDTKFKDHGEYSVKLILKEEDAQKLIEKLRPLHEEAIKEAEKEFKKLKPAQKKKLKQVSVNDFYEAEYDEEENETGRFIFNFKTAASGISKKTGKKWERKVPVFDSKRKAVNLSKVQIWSGTTMRIAFDVGPYFVNATGMAGITLYLNAVQIIELVNGGQRSAASYGFEEEEDGFDVAEADPASDFEDEDEGYEADDDDDDNDDAGEEDDGEEDF